jgi:VCBS repeat protein/centrosomal CEP192-like protein/ASPM-SPD-2-Hydin domain-containing protein
VAVTVARYAWIRATPAMPRLSGVPEDGEATMKARQLQYGSDLVGKVFGRGRRKDEARPRSNNDLASRCVSRRLKQVACTLLLLALAVSVTLAGRAAQNVPASAVATPNSTSLNGPGNVFLTANLFGSGGTGTLYAAVADFNGDGKLDYVTANQGNNTIGIALGNGDGTFKSPTGISVACNPVSVAVGDFNGDGKLDLAVSTDGCSPGTNGVAILLGNGDGTFTAGGKLTAPLSNALSAVVGDFNGDGKMDLAVVDRGVSTDSVFFFFGNGNGTFQAPTSVSLGGLAASNQIVAADFNKDGHLDVAVSEINGSNVVVILGAGNGTFQAPRTIALPAQGWGVAVGDFNGDGVPDLVATTPSNGGVSVFLGKGDGNFTPVNNPATGTLPTTNADVPGGGAQPIAVGDFNKDGKLDILAGLSGVSSAACVAVLLGNGDGTFQPELLFGVADTPQSLAVGDFNGDGRLDWMASTGQINSANTGSVTVGLGRGDGTFLAAEAYASNISPGFAAIADFNKDGKLDVVAPNQGASFYSVFLGNGDGTLQPAVNVAIPGILSTTAVAGDFNGDGNQDFVEYNNLGCPTLAWFFPGKGDGTFGAGIGSSLGACYTLFSTTRLVAADFNGDGKLDLATVISTGTGPAVAILLGNGDGTFQAPRLTPAPGTRPTWLEVADLNKDGKLDMVVTQYQENTIQIFLGNGDGTFQAPTTLATGRLPGFTALGDFNGDGNLDIFVGNQLDVNAEIFLGSGNGTFLAPSIVNIQPTNSPPSIQVVGDFNLDGHLDVLLGHNDNRGTGISLLLGNGDGTFQPVQNYLTSGFSGVFGVGDFNGDGAPDALLVDTAENFISILLNQTPPPVSVSPKSLTFVNQLVGTSSATQAITVTNNGATATTITIAASGDFAQTNTCPVSPATLAAAANCTINVAFKPKATGLRNGTITITHNLAGSPQRLALSGTGVAPVVSLGGTTSISFGNQLVGSSSTVQMVTLSNTGTATLTISSIVITGTNSGDFSETNTCGNSVTAGANCSISVTFKPTATGARSASLTITDNASGSPQSVALTGTGTVPVVSLGGTTSLNFGNEPVGSSSAVQNVTLSNTGTATLTISSIAIAGVNSTDYSETNTCGSSVAAGANCSISVTFKPTATGSRTASVSFTDNAAGSPQSVSLTGTGVIAAVTLSPLTLTFTAQLITTASAAQTVTLTNSGTAPLTISSIALSGTNSGDFSETNTCPAPAATLATGANCTISVTFKPSTTGNRVASVTVTDNASGGPQSASLTGTGTDYSLAAATGANCPANGNCSTSATITASQTATYDLQVTPVSGFNGTVSFTCIGAPAPSTCAVSPTSAPPNGSSSYAFAVTVNNTANALMPPSPLFLRAPWMPWMRLVLSLLSMIMTSLLIRRFFAGVRPVRILVPVAAALFFSLVYVSGCGGGGGGGGGPVVKPPTNATLTITGSSGTVNRTVNLSLTVNH